VLWVEIGERCGTDLANCPELERWMGEMLNYCEPLG
jgi:hypothetical protein